MDGDSGPNAPERVIGTPGDRVELRDGIVVVNGIPLAEPFGPTEPIADGPTEWLVPADHVFVLGDARRAAADSRGTYGFVPIAALIGHAFFRCAPEARRGPID